MVIIGTETILIKVETEIIVREEEAVIERGVVTRTRVEVGTGVEKDQKDTADHQEKAVDHQKDMVADLQKDMEEEVSAKVLLGKHDHNSDNVVSSRS